MWKNLIMCEKKCVSCGNVCLNVFKCGVVNVVCVMGGESEVF